MYVNAAFKTDEDAAWAFVIERGFGAVTAVDNGVPVAAHVPLLVVGDGTQRRLEFHLARANPLHRIIADAPHVLVVVSGPDAYISPDWYASADQVPTWNYMAAHLTGVAQAMSPDRALDHVERMSLSFENRLLPKKPWSTAKMAPQKRDMMLKAIVPIEVEVHSIVGSFKLSQNKPVIDRVEAARMLEWRGGAGERGIASAIKADIKAAALAKESA